MVDTFEYIKGYENLYKINKNGEIWSCIYGKIMKTKISDDKYKVLSLHKEKGRYKTSVHRLLALQYIDNPENHPEVDHIDRNRQNNSLDNLRWVTKVQNMNNMFKNLSNLNEEELLERKEKIKKYKTEWAKKDRLSKGVPVKAEMCKTKDPEYKKEWARKKRASLTFDEKQEQLSRRRELYKQKQDFTK